MVGENPATYHKNGCLVGASITILHCCVLAAFDFRQFNINLARSAHTKERTLHK